MSRLIDADAVTNGIVDMLDDRLMNSNISHKDAMMALGAILYLNKAPEFHSKTGYWMPGPAQDKMESFKCSKCGNLYWDASAIPACFCPVCGSNNGNITRKSNY